MKYKLPLFILVTIILIAANIIFPTVTASNNSTGGYSYNTKEENSNTVWEIGVSQQQAIKQITENSNNISSLSEFKQSVNNIITGKSNLFLFITLFLYFIFVLILLINRPRSYRLGLLRGSVAAADIFMLFCIVYSYNNLVVALNRAQLYYGLLVSAR